MLLTPLLDRLIDSKPNQPILLSSGELELWPAATLAICKKLKLLKKAAPNLTAVCPGCEEACLMPVQKRLINGAVHSFVICDKREDTLGVLIKKNSLEQWQVDLDQLADLMTQALATNNSAETIIPKQAYSLGPVVINRKNRTAIFTTSKDVLISALEADVFGRFPHPFFMVATGMNKPTSFKQGMALPAQRILDITSNHIAIHSQELNQILSTKDSLRTDLIPVEVPEETTWEQVSIIFINEQAVQICVAGQTEHRTFDEMGLSDSRTKEPTKLWETFKVLAEHSGTITYQESNQQFLDPSLLKKRFSDIGKKLQKLFPNISGRPFHTYINTKGYRTRFGLNSRIGTD